MVKSFMRKVKILARTNSSQRTKNRIAENGPWFFLKFEARQCLALENRLSVLIFSVGDNGWFGWLPLDEITVNHES